MKLCFAGKILPLIAALITALVVAGCATAQSNWDTRIGQFSYDDALGELGKPVKVETRPDGKTEAVWISRYRAASLEMDSGFYNHSPSFIGTQHDDQSRLRLTFTTNNILTDWSRD